MSDHYCPVEGCDYGDEQKNLNSVQGHINARSDDAHDWGELQERVKAQTDDADDADDEENDDLDDEGNEEAGESAPDSGTTDSDDGESSEEPTTETDESDIETMPTDDEYEQQRAARTDETDEDGDESDDGDGGDLPIPELPVDPRTLMMVVAVAGLAWLLYRTVSGSDEETPAPDPSETPEFEAPDDDDGDEVQGGLV